MEAIRLLIIKAMTIATIMENGALIAMRSII